MVSIFINWIYILITTFIIGEFFIGKLYSVMKCERQVSVITCIIFGMAINTAYAGYVSLFGGVSIVANVILICICCLFVWLERKNYMNIFYRFHISKKNVIYGIISLIGIVGIAYFCSNTNFMYDTGLYHAQCIRWNEDYGAVKGIANIHERLGYNSSYFLLCALYSMKDIFGQSLHAVQGLLAAVICVNSLLGWKNHLSRKYIVSNICRIAPIIYTLIILNELISPTTDYPTVYFIMWMVIEFVTLIEEQESNIAPFVLISWIAVFLVSLKLTAVCMILLAIYPAYFMIKEKRWREIGGCITIGLLLAAPYFIRNIIISGWLVYPFAAIDLFSVDWKIPIGTVIGDAADIKVYARYQFDRTLVDQSIVQWFPSWWNGQKELERYFSAAALLTIALELIYIVIRLFRLKKDRINKDISLILVNSVMVINILFWLFSSPLHRYGYAFVLTVPLLFIGTILDILQGNWIKRIIAILVTVSIAPLILYPSYKILWEDYYLMRTLLPDTSYFVKQKDYPITEMEQADVNGISIYYPKEAGGQSWYYYFPATNYGENIKYWTNRGEKTEDGFRNNE